MMADHPAITVVLPTYNSSRFVHDQVESILGQTYNALRLQILDDCSTDDTFEFLRAAYGTSAMVDLQQNEQNLGQNKTIERALRQVETPLFAISDHDDVWLPSKIADTVEELLSSGSDLCYTDLEVVGPDLEVIDASALHYSRMPAVRGRRPLPILLKNPVHGCTIVAHRALLDSALPFPDHLPHYDRWLALVACSGHGVSCVKQPLVRYRQHDVNTIGALPFSTSGLQRRAGGRSARAMTAFASERLADRVIYLDALNGRTGLSPMLGVLRRFIMIGRPLRVLLSPLYLLLVSLGGRELSWQTRLADTALVMIAPRPRAGPDNRHRIVTLDERGLVEASRRLATQVTIAGYMPTHLIAIATAGTHVAHHMAPAFSDQPLIVEIVARRPTTRLKGSRGLQQIVHRCPRWMTTALRHLEHRLITRRSRGDRTVSIEADQLHRLGGDNSSAVRALVVDDCVDSGMSLHSCIEFLTIHLGRGAELKSAVLAMSLPNPATAPDFCLYTNTSLRGPWSIDA